ncbi:MAG: GLUG motif-containing protein, partial [Planctomycetota bacterium]
GAGTESSPYLIRNPEQLNSIGAVRSDWDKHFKLVADIDLSAYPGTAYNMIGTEMLESFRGVFDGNDHTISNLNMTSTRERYAGLFGYVSGQIKNLGLANPKVFAQGINVGALAGFLDSGTLTRCYAKGVDVAGDDNIGGLVGYSTGRIYYCYSTGKVAGDWYVGGLIGLVTDSTVNASFSKAHVSGNGNVGGLAGKTGDETSVLSDCYATGNVTGGMYVGGLAGQVERGRTYKCYSTGRVSGNQYVGGFTGFIRVLGDAVYCFWDTQTSGQPTSGGGTGRTTAEMQTISTFTDAGWDFWNTWTMCEGTNYPVLLWQIPPADFRCPDGVDFIDFAFFAAHLAHAGLQRSEFLLRGHRRQSLGHGRFS